MALGDAGEQDRRSAWRRKQDWLGAGRLPSGFTPSMAPGRRHMLGVSEEALKFPKRNSREATHITHKRKHNAETCKHVTPPVMGTEDKTAARQGLTPSTSSRGVRNVTLVVATEVLNSNRIRRNVGDGHGNPLQFSCLENSMDRGAWQAAVHGAAKSWT